MVEYEIVDDEANEDDASANKYAAEDARIVLLRERGPRLLTHAGLHLLLQAESLLRWRCVIQRQNLLEDGVDQRRVVSLQVEPLVAADQLADVSAYLKQQVCGCRFRFSHGDRM